MGRRTVQGAGWVGVAGCLLGFIIGSVQAAAGEPMDNPLDRATRSLEASRSLTDYTAVLVKRERFGKKLAQEEEILFKFAKPFRVYMRWVGKVNRGQEALYVQGENKDRLKAHKGGFLGLVSVNVNPIGSMAMDGQHHPVFHAGIEATTVLVIRDLKRGLARKEVRVMDRGEVNLDGRAVVKVEAFFPETLAGETHHAKDNDTLWDVAERYDQDMYVILSANKGVDGPADIRGGQSLLVPHYYCQRSVSYFDVGTNLLVKIENYDWNGDLYESYYYKDLKLNVGLTDEDFDPKNKGYKF